MAEDVTIAIRADTSQLDKALKDLETRSDAFGSTLTGALKSAAVSGRALDDILRKVALDLAGLALDQGLKPLQSLTSSLFSSMLGGFSKLTPFAKGGVPGISAFSEGGIVSAPTFFPAGGRLGLMGEAGPEAIMPLKRGSDGSLGVAASAGGAPVHITFNVSAPDPSIFARSESQISQMLARTVSRGFRSF